MTVTVKVEGTRFRLRLGLYVICQNEGGIHISRPYLLPEKLFTDIGERWLERLAVVRRLRVEPGCKGISLWVFLWGAFQGCLPLFLQPLSDSQSLTFCLLYVCTRNHICTSNPRLIYFLALLPVATCLKSDLQATLSLRNINNRFQKLTGKVDYRRFCPVVLNCWETIGLKRNSWICP